MAKQTNTTKTVKKNRIIALDIMRGYFLAVIAIDHFSRFPSLFDPLTGRGRLWVSAAEGFFIISGIIVGYIYGSKMAQNVAATVKKIWKRAALLFGLSVAFTLLFTLAGRFLIGHEGLRSGLNTTDSWPLLIEHAFKLQYVYGWVDFLALYAVFMFIAPVAIFAVVKGKAIWLLIVSILCWYFFRDFDIRFGWQVFFMPGIILGYYLPRIEQRLEKLSKKQKNIFYSVATLIVLSLLAVSVYFVFAIPYIVNRPQLALDLPNWLATLAASSNHLYVTTVEPLFYKWTLPIGRILFAWLWFATLYLLVRHFESQILKYTKDFFVILGRNSLFTYCFMGILIFALHFIFIPKPVLFSVDKVFVNTLISIGLLTIIYLAAKYKNTVINLLKNSKQ